MAYGQLVTYSLAPPFPQQTLYITSNKEYDTIVIMVTFNKIQILPRVYNETLTNYNVRIYNYVKKHSANTLLQYPNIAKSSYSRCVDVDPA